MRVYIQRGRETVTSEIVFLFFFFFEVLIPILRVSRVYIYRYKAGREEREEGYEGNASAHFRVISQKVCGRKKEKKRREKTELIIRIIIRQKNVLLLAFLFCFSGGV